MVSPSRYECQQYFGQCFLSVVLLCLDECFYNVFNTRDLTLNAFLKTLICLFQVFGCAEFSLLQTFLQLGSAGAALELRRVAVRGFHCGGLLLQALAPGARGFSSCGSGLQSAGSVVVAHGLSLFQGMWDGIFLRAHVSGFAGGFFTTEPPRKP